MGELQRARILIVDDEEFMRKLLSSILRKAGLDALYAETGEEALQLLSENKCDIVISDVMMSGMSGIQLLKQVKELYPNIAFIIMTGFADSCTIKDALMEGADEYITKPFKNHEVTLVVERAYWRIQSARKSTEIV